MKLINVTFFLVVILTGSTISACHHREKGTKGSVDTVIRSYADTSVNGKRYTNLVVSAPAENLILRGYLEDAIASELLRYNVVAIQFTRLFPPTRQYPESEVKSVIGEYDFSAMLIVSVATDQMKDVGIASTSTAKTSGSSATSIFNTAYRGYPGSVYGTGIGVSSGSSKTTENSVSRRLAGRDITVDTALHELQTQQKVWVASLSSRVEEGSDKNSKKLLTEKEIAKNIAKAIASALKRDGLLHEAIR